MARKLNSRHRKLWALWSAAVLCFSPCAAKAAQTLQEVAKAVNIDETETSVSGISSGGFMAHQFHVAHSAHIMGVSIVAGGPYGCAEGDISKAVTKCSKFMALTCDDLLNGPIPHLAGLCNQPFTGPKTEEDAVQTAQSSFALAKAAAERGQIDAVSALSRARVFLFTGTNDEIVPYDVMNAVFHVHADPDKGGVESANIEINQLFPAHHTMVTDNFYKASPYYVGLCKIEHTVYGDPYIGDCRRQAKTLSDHNCKCDETAALACSTSVEAQEVCATGSRFRESWPEQSTCEQNVRREACEDARQVDLAGAILHKLYGASIKAEREGLLTVKELQSVSGSASGLSRKLASKMTAFSQAQLVEETFGEKDAGAWASFADTGYLYIPDDCANGAKCRLHVAFHGCKQGGDNDLTSPQLYGNIYARFAGYNEWAKNNRIVVLYPQVQAENFGPVNPQGCWDWWGQYYTGEDYYTQNGTDQSSSTNGQYAT